MTVVDSKSDLIRGSYLTERIVKHKEISSEDPHFKRWLEVGGFTLETFSKRLAKEGLTLSEFSGILLNKEVTIDDSMMPWVSKWEEILEWNTNGSLHIEGVFNTFYEPFLSYANDQLQQELQRFVRTYSKESALNIPEVVNSILESLHHKLSALSLRTLVSEMHIAKVTNQLKGDSPEERYQYFVDTFLNSKKKIKDLLQIYPVLARLMVETVERVIITQLESIERFLIDFDAICATFSGNYTCLTGIKAGAGDTHQEGRSVSVFVFASGDQLVYKPRSMSIDEHFNEFITWINEKGFSHKLSSAKVINRDTYGWQEFVSVRGCDSLEEVRRFYYRQGGYIALLYLLRSSDFHAENIIAHGEQPILIDLETLFTNTSGIITSDINLPPPHDELNGSVFSTLMLPFKYSTDMLIDFDLSAIGGEEGQVSKSLKAWTFENPFTDEMRLVQKAAVLEGSENRPSLKGEVVQAIDFAQEIEAGFREMYQLFLSHREELMDKSGPIYRFKDDRARHVLRPTHTYSHFLEASTHPDYLQDGLQRVQLFEYFWRITPVFPKYSEIVPMECRDMLEHDVPFFTFMVGGKDIYDGKGNKISDFYEENCIDLVIERCQNLSKKDCEKQSRYIRMSLALLIKDIFNGSHEEKSLLEMDTIKPSLKEEFLEQAIKIGDDIWEQALFKNDNGETYWIGLNLGMNNELILSSIKADIYEGTLGILLFLGHLAKETGKEKYEDLARKALNSMLKMIEEEEALKSISAFSGCTSISYGLAHLGLLWDDKELIQKAYEYLDRVERNLAFDKQLDLIGGAAGAILVSLRLHKLDPSSRALQVAEKCGEYLLERVRFGTGENSGLLTGISHGAAGYAWAFLELANVTGKEKFLEAGKKALVYERNHFVEKENNWADLRRKGDKKRSPVYWCHGAPGIGLSRLMIMDNLDDPKLYEEWQVAIEKTLKSGFGHGHSLCHGDFGNLDFLLSSARIMKDHTLEKRALEIGYQSMQQGVKQGWQFGLHKQAELIGLMLGLSGIGYGLLRLWNSEIPSILSFELPTKEEVK